MTEKTQKSFEGLKQTYIDIFKLSLEISSIESLEEIKKITQINIKREQLIKTALRIKASLTLKENEKKDIENLIEKIKMLDKKNIEKVSKMKEQISQDLANLNKSITLAGKYKSSNETKSRLVDTSE